MKFLRNLFLWIVLLAALALLYYVYSIRTVACVDPIPYVIGEVDPRFEISSDELESIAHLSTMVWEDSVNRNLFEKYEERNQGPVKEFLKKNLDKYYVRQPIVINLIYDERQARSTASRILATIIKDTKNSAEDIRKEFLNLQNNLEKAKTEYEAMAHAYRNGQISRLAIEKKYHEVNQIVDEINALINDYNYLVKEVNINVEKVNQYADQEFEEGEYVALGRSEKINIYEFANEQELTRVLAHEFGHALGLDHNENPDSIMYYLNESTNIEPTAEDLEYFTNGCVQG